MSATTRVVHDLAVLEADWRRLERDTPALTAFQTWGWVEAWWRTLGRRRPVHVVTVERDGTVVGMTVLHPTRLGLGPLSFELLTPLGQDTADEGLLALGDARDCGPEILDAVGALVAGGRRVVNVPRLREGGADQVALTSHPWPPTVRVAEEGRATCPVLNLAELTDPGQEIRVRTKKSDAPRMRRRLAEVGEVRLDLHTPVERGFDELLEVYDRRWADRDWEQGLLASEPVRAFAREAVGSMARQGVVWLSMLRLDERPIAACLGYRVGGTYLYHKPAFDPAFARFGPGHILLSEVVAACLDAGVQEVNLGRGEGGYKTRWASTTHDVVSNALAPARVPGALSSRLRHAALALRLREQRGRREHR